MSCTNFSLNVYWYINMLILWYLNKLSKCRLGVCKKYSRLTCRLMWCPSNLRLSPLRKTSPTPLWMPKRPFYFIFLIYFFNLWHFQTVQSISQISIWSLCRSHVICPSLLSVVYALPEQSTKSLRGKKRIPLPSFYVENEIYLLPTLASF